MSEADAPAPDFTSRRWWILAAYLSVLIMAPVDGSAVNIIIPVLQQHFNVPMQSLGAVAWVALAYLMVISGLMLPMGRLGDLWGFRRLYLGGAALFIAGSAACGLSPTLGCLIAARILQGLGACMMMALSPGITTAVFPAQERGRAMGMVAMVVAAGLAVGPTVGGVVAHWLGWRWVFFINLPIGVIGICWCRRVMPPLQPLARARPDMAGGLLAMAMLGAFLLAITHGHEWGWGSVAVLALLATALVTGAAFIAWQRRCSDPMLDLSMFRDRTFTGGNLASVVNYLALTTSAFLMPVLLQRALGFSPQAAGLLMALTPAAIIAIAPFSGAWSDRAGTRLLTVAGESAVTVALGAIGLLLTLAGAGVIGPERTVFLIAPLLALIGVGAGMFQSPNNSAVMGSVPRTHLGIGGGVLASMRNLGMAFGTAIGSAVTVGRMHQVASGGAATEAMGIVHGVAVGCFVGAVFAAFGVFTSLWRTAK